MDKATSGIGNTSVKIKYNNMIREISYKIWVGINTRKIGVEFDEEKNTIIGVYNSWYQVFGVIRKLLEEVPVRRINDAEGLIILITKILNEGLRPRLTKWQAKYRFWYENKVRNNENESPQELQRDYPEYNKLVKDLKYSNKIMIQFSKELQKQFMKVTDNIIIHR